jgi:hypothetical protein
LPTLALVEAVVVVIQAVVVIQVVVIKALVEVVGRSRVPIDRIIKSTAVVM